LERLNEGGMHRHSECGSEKVKESPSTGWNGEHLLAHTHYGMWVQIPCVRVCVRGSCESCQSVSSRTLSSFHLSQCHIHVTRTTASTSGMSECPVPPWVSGSPPTIHTVVRGRYSRYGPMPPCTQFRMSRNQRERTHSGYWSERTARETECPSRDIAR